MVTRGDCFTKCDVYFDDSFWLCIYSPKIKVTIGLLGSSADNFSKQFGPNQTLQNVRPNLNPNSEEKLFEKVDFEIKISRRLKSMKNYPACKELNPLTVR